MYKFFKLKMTISYKKRGKGRSDCVKAIPPIPFEKPTKKPLTKEQCHAHKLRSSPTSKDSPTHDLTVPHFGSGACEECPTFVKNFEKVSTC